MFFVVDEWGSIGSLFVWLDKVESMDELMFWLEFLELGVV